MKLRNIIRKVFKKEISNSELLKLVKTDSEALGLAAKHFNDEIKKLQYNERRKRYEEK